MGGIRAGILIPLLDNSEQEVQEMVTEVLRDVTTNTVVYLGDAAYVDAFSGACSRATPPHGRPPPPRTRAGVRLVGDVRVSAWRWWSAAAAVLSVCRGWAIATRACAWVRSPPPLAQPTCGCYAVAAGSNVTARALDDVGSMEMISLDVGLVLVVGPTPDQVCGRHPPRTARVCHPSPNRRPLAYTGNVTAETLTSYTVSSRTSAVHFSVVHCRTTDDKCGSLRPETKGGLLC